MFAAANKKGNAASEPAPERVDAGQQNAESDVNPAWQTLAFNALPAQTGGRQLDSNTRTLFEERFEQDFTAVRVHSDSAAELANRSLHARAFTQGQNIFFGRNQFSPNSDEGRRLIGHELAHVVQQRIGHALPAQIGSGSHLEAEADHAARAVTHGAHANVHHAADVGATQLSTLSDAVRDAPDKGAVFNVLRDNCPLPGDVWSPAGGLATDGDILLTWEIAVRFVNQPDDIWLATTIRRFGPEPLWPAAQIEERARRAHPATGPGWAPEPGNIGVDVAIPDATPDEAAIPPIQAYFFPGLSPRRAMIIGGVHGSEPQGASVVERVRTGLMTTTPFFSTLLVPTLIRRTAGTGQRYVGETGSQVARHQRSPQRYRTAGGARGVEPNRTYPGAPHLDEPSTGWTGQDYQSALQSGLLYQPAAGATPRAPAARSRSSRPGELADDDVHSSRMIAETRALIALIENFQPERIASIHAHSVPGRRGDAPGVFVDPRGGYGGGSPTSVGAATAEGQADDQLALAMLHQGLADPRRSTHSFRGNTAARGGVTGETVHYATSNHPEGSSLGDWAPSRGITTVTVEVPQGLKGVPLADVEEMHRDLLMQIFLADPSSVTPGSFTTPTPMRGLSTAPAPRRAP